MKDLLLKFILIIRKNIRGPILHFKLLDRSLFFTGASAFDYLLNHSIRANFIFGTLNSFNYFAYLHIIRVVRGHYFPNCKHSVELESGIVCLFRILINSVGSYILLCGIYTNTSHTKA